MHLFLCLFQRITRLIPFGAVVSVEVFLRIAVGRGLRIIGVVRVGVTEPVVNAVCQAWNAHREEIQNAPALALYVVSVFEHEEVVGDDKVLESAVLAFMEILAVPVDVDEVAQRHALATAFLPLLVDDVCRPAEEFDFIDSPDRVAEFGIKPSYQRLWKLPGEPREELPCPLCNAFVLVGDEQTNADAQGVCGTLFRSSGGCGMLVFHLLDVCLSGSII